MSKAKNWAIVVGINQYKHIGHLKYANRDAEAMAAFFREVGFDRVFCFADELTIQAEIGQQSTLPRSSDLMDFLHDRFTSKPLPLKTGDNCWFFFAGHGKRLENRDCLLPQDYNPRIPAHEKRAIPVELVRESLLKSGADNVILLLDACRTEGDRDGNDGIGDSQPGAITIFSCERNKKSYEIDDLQHGAFTAALLEGLQMPKSEENCATVERLDCYLRDRVPKICRSHPERPVQNPKTVVDPEQKWCFLLLPRVATEHDINKLKIEAFRVMLFRRDLELAEKLWIRVNAIAQGEDSDAIQALQHIGIQRILDSPDSTRLKYLSLNQSINNDSSNTIQTQSNQEGKSAIILKEEMKSSPDKMSESDLDATWKAILDDLGLASTKAIVSPNCFLMNVSGTTVKIGVRGKKVVPLIKIQLEKLSRSCRKILNLKIVYINLVVVESSASIETAMDLDETWKAILSNLGLASTRAVISSNCFLMDVSGTAVKIGIRGKHVVPLVKVQLARLSKSCAKVLGISTIKLNIVVHDAINLDETWQAILENLGFDSTKAIISPNCCLISVDGKIIRIGVKGELLVL
jgi:uncharacterized caspase-like protein